MLDDSAHSLVLMSAAAATVAGTVHAAYHDEIERLVQIGLGHDDAARQAVPAEESAARRRLLQHLRQVHGLTHVTDASGIGIMTSAHGTAHANIGGFINSGHLSDPAVPADL